MDRRREPREDSAARLIDASVRPRSRRGIGTFPVAVAPILLFALIALAPSLEALQNQSAKGNANLSGRVVLGLTGEPAIGAEVDLPGQDRSALTGEGGSFLLRGLAPGTATVFVRYLGSTSVPLTLRLTSGATEQVELAIAGPMFHMEEILVEVRGISSPKMRGFETRKNRSSGVFITREDIESRDPLFPSSLLDGVAGARAVQDPDGRRKVMVGAGRNACEPDLYLDGSQLQSAWLDEFLPDLIEAIEFYPRWHMRPQQFRDQPKRDPFSRAPTTQEACGAIVVWTREFRVR